jgi:threonine aldolase
MMCFSKGMGAPVGSILSGPREVIRRARRFRKMLGGGIRQGGVLAAACLYALDHHRERLAEDHARAARLARALAGTPGLAAHPGPVETNMVLIHLDDPSDTPEAAANRARVEGVWVVPFGPRTLRAVLHLDVDDEALERAIAGLRKALAWPAGGRPSRVAGAGTLC